MPRIGELLGVFFYLYYADHGLIYIHAYYGDKVAVIALNGDVLEGSLPAKKLKIARKFVLDNTEFIEESYRQIKASKLGTGPAPKLPNLSKSTRKRKL